MSVQTRTASASGARSARLNSALLRFFANYGFLPVILVVLYIAFGIAEPAFFSATNALNIINQASFLVILAAAQMFALLTRGFDLSLGATISMVSVASAMIMSAVAPGGEGAVVAALAAGVLGGVVIGMAVGTVNGLCVAYLGISPFLVTLGVQGVAFGLATTISGGFPVFDTPLILIDWLGSGYWFGVLPPAVAVCLLVLLFCYVVLNHTVLGRSLYILGANPRAAEVGGLPWRRNNAIAYVICSGIGAVGAIMMMARSGTGEPNLGGGLMLQSIAAAVIGGVALRGGEGRVIHVLLGGLLVTVIAIGMNLSRVDGFLQEVVLGIVVIAAVFLDRLRLRIRL